MEVLVVSKTKMQHGICVGGITMNGISIRFLEKNGYHPKDDTKYDIGQIWDIVCKLPTNPRLLPHSEDVCVNKRELKGILSGITMIEFLNEINVHIYQGDISDLFESKIQFTQNGTGFINKSNIPNNSVCFWRVNRDMLRNDYNEKKRYNYKNNTNRWGYNIPYVGLSNPINIIPKGTLIRMSLAHWWSPANSDTEERCYLQLSGWYDI